MEENKIYIAIDLKSFYASVECLERGLDPLTINLVVADASRTQKTICKSNSIGSGQVLHEPYTFEKAKLIVKEMTDLLVLDLVAKRLVTNQMVLTIGYDRENLSNDRSRKAYHGEISLDSYGRKVPKHAHGVLWLQGCVGTDYHKHFRKDRLSLESQYLCLAGWRSNK